MIMKNHITNELEEKIHGYIRNLYGKKYINRLEVEYNDGVYTLIIGIPTDYNPTFISYQTENTDDFLKYICEELRTRNYLRVRYHKINYNETFGKRK